MWSEAACGATCSEERGEVITYLGACSLLKLLLHFQSLCDHRTAKEPDHVSSYYVITSIEALRLYMKSLRGQMLRNQANMVTHRHCKEVMSQGEVLRPTL